MRNELDILELHNRITESGYKLKEVQSKRHGNRINTRLNLGFAMTLMIAGGLLATNAFEDFKNIEAYDKTMHDITVANPEQRKALSAEFIYPKIDKICASKDFSIAGYNGEVVGNFVQNCQDEYRILFDSNSEFREQFMKAQAPYAITPALKLCVVGANLFAGLVYGASTANSVSKGRDLKDQQERIEQGIDEDKNQLTKLKAPKQVPGLEI